MAGILEDFALNHHADFGQHLMQKQRIMTLLVPFLRGMSFLFGFAKQ